MGYKERLKCMIRDISTRNMPRLIAEERGTAIGVLLMRSTCNDVANALECHRLPVIRLIQRYRETGVTVDRTRGGRPRITTIAEDCRSIDEIGTSVIERECPLAFSVYITIYQITLNILKELCLMLLLSSVEDPQVLDFTLFKPIVFPQRLLLSYLPT